LAEIRKYEDLVGDQGIYLPKLRDGVEPTESEN
jgi:hypothetical protein